MIMHPGYILYTYLDMGGVGLPDKRQEKTNTKNVFVVYLKFKFN